MDYTTFANIMKGKIQQRLGRSATIKQIEVVKNNGVRKEGLIFSYNMIPISPVIYLSELYGDYQNGDSLETCAKKAADILENNRWDETVTARFLESIQCWEKCKYVIYPVLMDYKANEDFLKTLVHQSYLDLAICYYLCLGEEADGTMSMPVNQYLWEMWNISKTELHTQALRNMESADYHMESMAGILKELLLIDEDIEDETDGGFSILTNRRMRYGAAGVLKKDLLNEFADKVKKN